MLGEVSFDALGARWTMFLGNAAQCAMEEHFDKGFFAVIADAMPNVTPEELEDPEIMMAAARDVRVSTLRDIAWFAFHKHHNDITPDKVSDLIDAIGSGAFGDMLGKAIAGVQDKGAGQTATGKKPASARRPTRAKGRTGKS